MALQCELCMGTEFAKQDGFFVCQSCGMKYSLEEARKMMTGDVGTPPPVASAPRPSANIENYLDMAKSALDSSNNKEAENYCNKVIEIDFNNYKAWMYKGKAVGWQSTLGNNRFEEASKAFIKAVNNAPEEELENVKAYAKEEMEDLFEALLRLRVKNFKPHPSDSDTDNLKAEIRNMIMIGVNMIIEAKVIIETSSIEYSKIVNIGICDAWKKTLDDYEGENYRGDRNRPTDHDFQTFLNEAIPLYNAFESALTVNASTEDNVAAIKQAIQVLKNKNVLAEIIRDSKSYDYTIGSYSNYYAESKSLTAQAKQYWNTEISTNNTKIRDLNKQLDDINNKKVAEYWEKHPEEKAELDAQLKDYKAKLAKVSPLAKSMAGTEIYTKCKDAEFVLEELKRKKSSISIFKRADREAAQREIDGQSIVVAELTSKLNAEHSKYINEAKQLEGKVNEVERKLKNPL